MSDWVFVRRVLTVLAIGALALALWTLSDLLLLIFAAVLSAIALRALAAPLAEGTGMREPLALMAVVLLLVTFAAALVLQFGSLISEQTVYVLQNAPAALQSLAQALGLDLNSLSRDFGGSALGALASRAVTIGSSIIEGVAAFILVVVGGLYLAAAPQTYRRGLIALFPERWHKPISSTVDDSAFALTRWLRAQLIAMALVGTMTGLGMWLVGVPSPLALGLIAGVTEFIPIVGPIVGAIPALLLASSSGWELTLAALAVAVVVQQLENNLIMPFVVGRVVELPAAVGLFATVAMGLLFGPLGLLLGYPLAIVADVTIRRLYVREALGKTVEIPAERERHAEAEAKPAA
ncbi:AI-2E family transporter [Hyphomicrobium sp.]|uniref:AI-2E family transporter n=1 Tax=Hyphomicrobium sp. TaxID=82 RepID=UPI0025BFD1E6|nr:AI-2E family transporter [Hyphomicrobium sp.]MCC7252840.1 AI-2E family transporter [Hyphomicrobium sp.]